MDLSTDLKRVIDVEAENSVSSGSGAPVTSRFFASETNTKPSGRTPNILVPSSSPESAPVPLTYTPKMGHHPPTGGSMPSLTSSIFSGRMMQEERLGSSVQHPNPSLLPPSQASGITSTSASTSSSRSSSVRRRDDTEDGAPPRKKMNAGSLSNHPNRQYSFASSSTTRQSTPDSLQGVRDGVNGIVVTDLTGSSPSPERPRGKLVRGRQASSMALGLSYTPKLPGTTFRNSTPLDHLIKTNPNVSPTQIQHHYFAQGGDANRTIAALGGSSNYPNSVGPIIDVSDDDDPLPAQKVQPPGRASIPYTVYSPTPIPTLPSMHNTRNIPGSKLQNKPPPPRKPMPDSDEDSDFDSGSEADAAASQERIDQALKWFNEATEEQLVEVTACNVTQAKSILELKPFESEVDIRKKLQRKKGVSPRYFDDYIRILEGYSSVDGVIEKCEKVGKELSDILAVWASLAEPGADSSISEKGAVSGVSTPTDTSGVNIIAVDAEAIKAKAAAATGVDPMKVQALEGYMSTQPATLAEGAVLKDYQLLGVNWLSLLHRRKLSCILADEMGLGKTIQVIAFLCSLKEKGSNGPHLVVVPSSTLENWGREFENFAPELSVQTYYGAQQDRVYQRAELNSTLGQWDVCITTYNLAQGTEHDRKFFKKIDWECCVFDEGHVLKNFQSQRYYYLLKIPSKWRLMLTGTPLQNNLQELVSLMNFILPEFFKDVLESLRAVFKASANSSTSFLSESRVKRASKMMTPFVLRRRKDQVLKDLPKKTERVEWCELTMMQKKIYDDALARSRKVLQELPNDEKALLEAVSIEAPKKGRPKKPVLVSSGVNSSNILMELRKASLHPMLFRRLFDDAKVNVMARHCLSEPEFEQSKYELVVEDMQVMNDAELQWFCKQYSSVRKHALEDNVFLDAGKITRLLALLEQYQIEGKRVLIFSQFTQVLDILKVILDLQKIRYLILTGQTAVNERQTLVDEFNEDGNIPVFLLSTRAGGMGINLTAACVVIIFDQDFNPHNDKQACDRAYRIGQKRDVEVVKFITRGTIEESMHQLGQVKLVLDQAVTAGEGNEEEETRTEKTMKASLLSELRKQFEEQEKNTNGQSTAVTAT